MNVALVWAVYLIFWGLLIGFSSYADGKGWRGFLVGMAYMVAVGLIFTWLAAV